MVGARSIPPLPAAAQKAFQLATDPNADARDFIEVIETDEGLSARVLKIANSVYFDRGQGSETIEQSVVVIGINELRCLLNATTLSEIFPSKHPARMQLWAHDIATALISRTLAQRIVPAKADLVFLAGLMHDVGKLLLIQRASEFYNQVLKLIEQEGLTFSVAEERIFSFSHTEVGQLIGEKWHFSPELIEIIRNHHHPWSKNPAAELSLTEIVRCADTIAHALGLGHPKGFSKLRSRAEQDLVQVWAALRVPEQDQREQLAQFQKSFEVEYDLYAGKGIQ